jgi:uncharacterized protein (TIGR03437 family)
LNSSSGAISGTPGTAGSSSFSVTVKDSLGNTSNPQALSITIDSAVTVATTSPLPNASVGVAYSQTLAASGGQSPYSTWTITTGTLPAGLTLNSSTGAITGTPSTTGSSTFSVTVKDSLGAVSQPQSLTLTVSAGVTVGTVSLPNGALGVAYSQTLSATGGKAPYSSWTVTLGSLPGGLSLNAATGLISGTPSAAGAFSFSVTVKDSNGNTSPAQALSITIVAPPTVVTTTLPSGTVGVMYSQTLTATGGTPPYSNWAVTSGSLPAGLSLSAATGTISGVPTTGGVSSFKVTVTDSASNTSAAQSLSITIGTPLAVATLSLPGGTLGVGYSQTLAATGGVPPYTNWIVTAGALPPGLTLNAASGVISGTPTTATGSPFGFSVTVSDSAKNTSAPQALSIAIGTAVLKLGSPSNYFFTLPNTSAPVTNTVQIVSSSGSALPFTIAATPTAFNWLTFTPTSGVTPATIKLTANPSGLVPGTYLTPLTVTSGSLTLTFTAQLTVTGSNLVATPSMLTFTYQPGTALPAAQPVTITPANGVGTVPLASVTANVQWIKVTSATQAPATVQVSLNPGLLSPGTYSGSVLVTGQGSPQASLEIPVVVTINSLVALTASPASLSFTYQIGQAAPAAQSFMVAAGNAALNFTATAPGNWVTVNPVHGVTPGTVMVTINPAGLAPGTFGGTINVSAPGASNTVPITVSLTVTGAPQLTISPSSLSFSAPTGGAAPSPQTLMVTSGSGALNFTAAAGSYWLGVTPTSGTTPASLSVSVNTAGLATGVYTGTINITPSGSPTPQMAIVTLTVGTPAVPTIAGIINAASGAIGTVSPGMAVSIFGSDLGPTAGASFALPPTGGSVATTLGGTQVLFDGTPVPVLYASNTQVNALVPFELANKTTALTVTYGGMTSTAMTLPVIAALPGLFTASATGTGQGAILNQDYSINSSSNPAAAGSAVMIFGTGGGVTIPPSVDGALNPISTTGKLALTTTATVGGQPATVLYAGPAPGLVGGVIQVNVTIPAGTPSGNAPVVIQVGTASSQTGVTVAVQ